MGAMTQGTNHSNFGAQLDIAESVGFQIFKKDVEKI
jgi:hypothetical protein